MPPTNLLQGTLDLLILKALALGALHGLGVSRRIEQISKGVFKVNAGSLFPALRRLEREGLIAGEWHVTENNRRAKYYALTAAGRKQLERETREWHQTADLIAAFLAPRREAR